MSWSGALTHRPGHHAPLDGLRALAVLLVVGYHWLPGLLPQGLMNLGWSGVDLFFVLSGFLITGQLLEERSKPGWYGRFIARRALRVLPLYYVALLLFVAWARYSNDPDARATLAGMPWFWTYTQNLWFSFAGMPGDEGFLNHFWSLGVEEQFYLLWPLVIAFSPGRWLPWIALGGMLLGLGLRHMQPVLPFAFAFPFAHADGLLWGSTIAWAIRYKPRVLTRIWMPILLSTLAALVILVLGTAPVSIHHPLFIRWAPLLFPLFFAALLCATFAAGPGWERLWQRPLSAPVFTVIARYSYGIYVIHWPVLLFRSHILEFLVWAGADAARAGPLFAVLYFPLVLLLALLSYHALEQPFLRLKRHFRTPGTDLQATR
jgi:peptidoglycan/LPS O-acetylase OafA/YrhL